MFDGHRLEPPTVQDQGRRLDQREDGAHIDLGHGAQEQLGVLGAGAGPLPLREPAQEAGVAGAAGRQEGGQLVAAPQAVELGQRGLDLFRGAPDRVVAGGREPGRGVHQDQRAGPFRPGRGEQQRRRASVELGHDRRPLAAHLVQHRGQLLGIGLPWGQAVRREGVGRAGAAPVEQDQPAERGQAAQEQGGPRGPPRRCRCDRSCGGPAPGRAGRCRAPGRRSGPRPAGRTWSRAARLTVPWHSAGSGSTWAPSWR
jgi:hypothetical protein